MVDLEALARQFNGGRPAVQKTGSDLMVFVSLSMPEHVIKALARQAKEAGAVMVLRGLKGGSWPETWKALAALNQGIGRNGSSIPRASSSSRSPRCPASCWRMGARPLSWKMGVPRPASYAALAGDVSIEQALGIMKMRGEPVISQLAVDRLGRLRRAP
jgi:type-F conjugative transfer system pilin assembly protein TrbC